MAAETVDTYVQNPPVRSVYSPVNEGKKIGNLFHGGAQVPTQLPKLNILSQKIRTKKTDK